MSQKLSAWERMSCGPRLPENENADSEIVDSAQLPRANIKHLTDQLRGYAERMTQGHYFKSLAYPWHQFREDLFYIVPFDALLHLFSKTLQQYPLESVQVPQDLESRATQNEAVADCSVQPRPAKDEVDDALADNLAATALTESENPTPKEESVYPPLIRKAVEEAILGLPYVYETFIPFSDKAVCKIPRTKYTPYSARKHQSSSPNHDVSTRCRSPSSYFIEITDEDL